MRVLAIEKEVPGVAADRFTADVLTAEARHVWQLQQSGTIREIYFRADETSAVVVLECADATDARRVLAGFPLVAAGLIDFEVIPLIPYPGFARLFAG